ncbi:MAG: hypothetical protein K5912_03510 [Alphaproteobacteria bacterium]|nr:hypothetical protein [Alphaproteobacteria bacterium]
MSEIKSKRKRIAATERKQLVFHVLPAEIPVRLRVLVNEKLKRSLTDKEVSAVKWRVENVLSISPKDSEKHENAIRSLIVCGNVPQILKEFVEHANDKEWISSIKLIIENNKRTEERARELRNQIYGQFGPNYRH